MYKYSTDFIYLRGSRNLVIRYNVFTVKEGSQNNISCISGAAYKSWHYLLSYLAAISLKQAEFEIFPIWNDFGTWPRYLVFRTFPLLAPWYMNHVDQIWHTCLAVFRNNEPTLWHQCVDIGTKCCSPSCVFHLIFVCVCVFLSVLC